MSLTHIDDDLERLPGLFNAWDLGLLVEAGRAYVIEDGGRTDDGLPLFMVYRRSATRCVRGRGMS